MSFATFARAHGLEVGEFHASERIQRCATTEHPRSKNGAFFFDGSRGWVFAWDGEARTQWYDDPNATPWTDEEKRAWAMRQEVAAADRQRKHENAARRAAMVLRSTVPSPHDYLLRKGLRDAQGLVMPKGELFVPMRRLSDNQLQGGQVIRWDEAERKWDKKMLPGMRAKGAVLRLGPPKAREACLCEGYATGLSIELAARQARLSLVVIVTFSDSNLVHVAGLMKDSAIRRFVFADNDKSGAGERAAKDAGLPYCMSDREGEDANDVHARSGLMAVQRHLMQARGGHVP
jgi:putative DNA primase/helicase